MCYRISFKLPFQAYFLSETICFKHVNHVAQNNVNFHSYKADFRLPLKNSNLFESYYRSLLHFLLAFSNNILIHTMFS